MSSFADSGWKSLPLASAVLSPAVATTAVLATFVGIGQTPVCIVDAQLLGATGGTLDFYLQSAVDADQAGNGTWYDICHFPQLAAAAALTRFVATFSRGFNKVASAPNTANPTSATPTLAVNTLIPDALGNAIRLVAVAGAGTSAGAAQTVKMGISK